jgi:hypothetical protein
MKTKVLILLAALIFQLVIFVPITFADGYLKFGLEENDFYRISTGGFGDSANSYSWGIAHFNNALYVGTNRHHLWSIGLGMESMLGTEIEIDIVEDPEHPIGTVEWANEMRGEIWRYRCGEWERVYQSEIFYWPGAPNPLAPPAGWYPKSYGYRMMGVFEGKLYVCGIGTWWPPMPFSSVLVSDTGDPGSWQDITGILATTNNVRGLVEFNGNLFVSASVPGASVTGAGLGVVYRYAPESAGKWIPVSEEGFGSEYNTEVPYMIVFNDHLYASTLNYETGFEVWKTDGTIDDNGKYVWEKVVSDGFGDTWNQWGMTMEVFNDHLYVGSAVGGGFVIKNNEIVGTKAFDVIRIDKDDNAELVVGTYFPRDPPSGWPTYRTPLSKWPAGFGNPLNFYVWHMEVHDGVLYLGTFDACGLIRYLPELIEGLLDEETWASLQEELQSALNEVDFQTLMTEHPEYAPYIEKLLEISETTDPNAAIELIVQYFGGADLWKTYDGIHWVPVTLNGFNNPNNYGVRRLLSVCDCCLFVGTANPFTGLPGGGCEVLAGMKHAVVSCSGSGDIKLKFYQHENVYVKGEGFPPCTDVMIYVIPDGEAPEPSNAVASSLGTTDEKGKLPVTLVWEPPLNLGKYDVWVDVNQNGEYDCCDAYVVECIGIYLFMAIPEIPGSIAAVLAMIASCAIYRVKKRKKCFNAAASNIKCE